MDRPDGPITRTKYSPVQEAPDKTRQADCHDHYSDSGQHGVKGYASSDERQADPHQLSILSFVLLQCTFHWSSLTLSERLSRRQAMDLSDLCSNSFADDSLA
jgi:hypothetical protein